jgi:UDP-N-acetylmuramoyl-L-alanyl-D-glutamate--2,6-diaminopimelate ligase
VTLQRTLQGFRRDGLKACAIEASSIGLVEHRLAGTRLRVAIFTNLTQDHLDYHTSMQAYGQAKRHLFNWPGLAAAVINTDDPFGADLARSLATQPLDVWTVSCQGGARLCASDIHFGEGGLCFSVTETGSATHLLQSHLIGHYNVANLLGVLGAMRALGIPLDAAVGVCSRLLPVPGRMECLSEPDAPLVAVDYAHTPDALGQALQALRPLALDRAGQLWCVFGCGGDRDASKRPLMGAIATQKADRTVLTSDNPRSEVPDSIIADILRGVVQSPAVHVEADRGQAIAYAVTQASDRDVILLAGKGHEETQDVGGVKRPFSDRIQALRALQERNQVRQGIAA